MMSRVHPHCPLVTPSGRSDPLPVDRTTGPPLLLHPSLSSPLAPLLVGGWSITVHAPSGRLPRPEVVLDGSPVVAPWVPVVPLETPEVLRDLEKSWVPMGGGGTGGNPPQVVPVAILLKWCRWQPFSSGAGDGAP